MDCIVGCSNIAIYEFMPFFFSNISCVLTGKKKKKFYKMLFKKKKKKLTDNFKIEESKAPFVCWKVVSFWKVNSGKVFSDVW